jgi:hypothetical protein
VLRKVKVYRTAQKDDVMRRLVLLIIVRAVSIGSITFASEKPAARSLDELPADARKQFEELQTQYANLAKQRQAEWDDAYRKDPLLRQAREGRNGLDHKIAAARQKMMQDVEDFVATGRGDKALFEYWQSHYRRAVCKKEMAEDEFQQPYRDWWLNTMFENRTSAPFKKQLESAGFKPDEVTLEQMPKVFEKLMNQQAQQSQKYLDQVEPTVQPSDEAKQHVLEFSRYFDLDGTYANYSLIMTPPKFKKLHKQTIATLNQMTAVWPNWREALLDTPPKNSTP